MNIGIFSGSFNPIHIGHLILANYISEFTDIDEVWFLVSPQNPLKNDNLEDEQIRLEMVNLALSGYPKLKACDFEFSLPRPSYTVNTLDALKKKYTEHKFSLIIGADNWKNFELWKDYKTILNNFDIYIYPRLLFDIEASDILKDNITILDSPIIEISSTFIRNSIKDKKNVKAFLSEKVYEYISKNNLYK
ncbi:nicotinate-nucleotide adenylyltransferase [Dysgonomonas sp. 216]|uniref:nicotinate (nicotinamide) nucleotide adenylyltransferase n=1 Tax=Dysgonomonas sp. 216 TaxID=2302934 RepID=UPI0013D414D0|nr:nicotinate (nicotinamide) nucleotide adenylyltransferase [Dysgonomonas sp. 216]NDW17957.1 nicotinate-nucleotide adenylyltransferase [Dysgonomonas sp. 216]